MNVYGESGTSLTSLNEPNQRKVLREGTQLNAARQGSARSCLCMLYHDVGCMCLVFVGQEPYTSGNYWQLDSLSVTESLTSSYVRFQTSGRVLSFYGTSPTRLTVIHLRGDLDGPERLLSGCLHVSKLYQSPNPRNRFIPLFKLRKTILIRL